MIETERLVLRPWTEADAEDMYRYASEPMVSEMAMWPVHTSLEMSREVIRQYFAPNKYAFAIVLKQTGEAIGSVGLVPSGSENYPVADNEREVGYWVGMQHWGGGIATEALEAMISYCRRELRFDSLLLTVDLRNAASRWVAEKCGFSLMATFDSDGMAELAYRKELPAAVDAARVEIREYRSSDLPAIALLFYDTVHNINARDYTPEQINAWATGAVDFSEWDKSLKSHHSFVAVDGAQIVGFGDIDCTGYLDRLYVHHARQREGIATAICDSLEAAVGHCPVRVHASITAKPFFERRGYRVVHPQIVERSGIMIPNFVMKHPGRIIPGIRKAIAEDYPELVDVWERSVRASHRFLSEEHLQDIKTKLPDLYFPNVDLYVIEAGKFVAGFIGLSADMIEMLFIDEKFMRHGLGSRLIEFAIDKGMDKVDVNEQNPSALKFYRNHGFKIIGRSETDADGRPYPIIHLSR